MDRAQLFILAGSAVAVAYMVWRWQQAQQDTTATDGVDPNAQASGSTDSGHTIAEDIVSKTTTMLGLWRAPAKYAPAIAASEDKYGIPAGMLERLLYQESRYRADIIDGRTRSPVGALGIAQFMPATAAQMGINPLDPFQAIDGAGRYLAGLYRQTGGWTEALAAYNWGIGNVSRRGIARAPTETRNYYTQILADVNNANGTTYA